MNEISIYQLLKLSNPNIIDILISYGIDVTFNGSLYPEQRIAASKMLSVDYGILSATTSFGKTVLGSYLISQRKVNTLVLVHNVEILNNWITDLSPFLP